MGAENLNAKGFAVMLGLINSRAHLVQSSILAIAKRTDFVEWVCGYYFPMTRRLDEQHSSDAVQMTLLISVSGGCSDCGRA